MGASRASAYSVTLSSFRTGVLDYLVPRRLPVGTQALLLAVTVIYFVEIGVVLVLGVESWSAMFELRPDSLARPWTILVSPVSHVPWPPAYHLLPNVAGLWLAAAYVERRLGAFRMLCLFFVAGVLAQFADMALRPRPMLGASGGVLGLGGWIAVDFWRRWQFSSASPWQRYAMLVAAASIPVILGYSVLGYLSGEWRTGHVAHASGLVLGMWAAVFLTAPVNLADSKPP